MTDKKVKILIVDDSELIRKSLTLIIKRNLPNFELLEAEDGLIAMQKVEENDDINIIFLDWNMPNMTGDAVVEAIRANPKYNNMRIIMVTTEASRDKISSVMRNGANGYVQKPFQMEQMKRVLQQLVGRL